MTRPVDATQKFQTLLTNHEGILFRVTNTYARLPEDQQDLLQEIKLNLWRAFPNYDPVQAFSTWAYRVSLNTAISWFRRHSAKPSTTTIPESVPAKTPISDDRAQILLELIAALDPLNRALLTLYLDDIPQNDIAEIVGTSPGNVATRISRIKAQLRQQFNSKEKN